MLFLTLPFFVPFKTVPAITLYAQPVFFRDKAVFFTNVPLQFLNVFISEFDDFPAPQADHMVMVQGAENSFVAHAVLAVQCFFDETALNEKGECSIDSSAG